MRFLLVLLILLPVPVPALADSWVGVPRVVDGDSLVIEGRKLRLLNVDAFETDQVCMKGDREYRCGIDATFALLNLIRDREVTCEGDQRDRYGRMLVHCTVDGIDLGRAMVALGWALSEFASEYLEDQEHAQERRLGAWAGTFQAPRDWRRMNRSQFR